VFMPVGMNSPTIDTVTERHLARTPKTDDTRATSEMEGSILNSRKRDV
jgi:hypothetical protein